MYSPIDEIGRMNCSYHPEEYNEDTGFKCCGKKFRVYKPVVYADGFGTGFRAEVPEPKGCSKCDHGSYSEPIDLKDYPLFAEYLVVTKSYGDIFTTGENYTVQRYLKQNNTLNTQLN